MPPFASLFSLPLLLLLKVCTAQVVCYYPNQVAAAGHVPCPGVNASSPGPCCNYGTGWPHIDPCMSNGFCYSQNIGVMYRGSCSDSTWGAKGCATECRSIDNVDGRLVNCANGACCSGDSDTCCDSNGNGDFTWPNANFLGPLNVTQLQEVVGNAPATITGLSNTNTAATVTVTAASNNDSSSSSNSTSSGALIGLGLGLGVPLLVALGTIAWLAMQFKRLKKMQRIKAGEGTAQPFRTETKSFLPSIVPYQGEPKYQPAPQVEEPVSELYGGRPDPIEAPGQ